MKRLAKDSVLFIIILAIVCLLAACAQMHRPVNGVWYSEELKLTIFLGESRRGREYNAEIDLEGQDPCVVCLTDRGSNYIEVLTQTPGEPTQWIFVGRCVSLNDDQLCVIGCDGEYDGIEFWFERID